MKKYQKIFICSCLLFTTHLLKAEAELFYPKNQGFTKVIDVSKDSTYEYRIYYAGNDRFINVNKLLKKAEIARNQIPDTDLVNFSAESILDNLEAEREAAYAGVKSDSLGVKNVTLYSTNGHQCQLQLNSSLDDSSYLYEDISDDGCYPKAARLLIETELGIWEYVFGKGIRELTGLFVSNPNAHKISLSLNRDTKQVIITSNVDQVEVSVPTIKYKNAHSMFGCRAVIPNSTRTTKTLRKGDSFTFDAKHCDLNNIEWIDSMHGIFLPYSGEFY